MDRDEQLELLSRQEQEAYNKYLGARDNADRRALYSRWEDLADTLQTLLKALVPPSV